MSGKPCAEVAGHGTEVFVPEFLFISSSTQERAGNRAGTLTRCFSFLIRIDLVLFFSFILSFYWVAMAIWDSIGGRKQAQGSSDPFDPSNAQDATSFLSDAAIPDPTQLHPLSGLNEDTLDYLTLEDSALDELPGSRSVLPSRGWSDDLCYGTGTTYLAGLSLGGAWGLAEGLRRTPVTAPPKIRLNGVLNSVTRRGPFLGNSAGVVAMVYNGLNSSLGYARGKHDSANSIMAGALSGMVFKSTRGLRPMAISGGIVAGIAGGWAVSAWNTLIVELVADYAAGDKESFPVKRWRAQLVF